MKHVTTLSLALTLAACASSDAESTRAIELRPAEGHTVVKLVRAPARAGISQTWQRGESPRVTLHSGSNPRYADIAGAISASSGGSGLHLWLGEDAADGVSFSVDTRTDTDGVSFVLVRIDPEAYDETLDEAFATMEREEALRRRQSVAQWLDPLGSGKRATSGGN